MKHIERRGQRGYVLWVILILLVAMAGGAWKYSDYRREAKRLAAEQEQRRQVEAEQARKDKERRELEARLDKERQEQDALIVSIKSVDELLVRWDDAVKVAGGTGRIALSGPVERLQTIKRDADRLTVPPCMDQAKGHLTRSMDYTIEGYLAFMRNEFKSGDILAAPSFEFAGKQMKEFIKAREICPA